MFRIRLNGSQYGIHEEVLNFLDWTLCYHEFFHDNRKKFKSMDFFQWICDIQIMWKLSYLTVLKIIRFELFEHWTMLILLLFLIMIFSIWLTIKPSNLRKFYSQIWKNMIKPPSLSKGSYKISLVRQSILSVGLWRIFLRIHPVDFLNFLDEDFFPYILKSEKARIWKIAFVV